jgi:hypothetical protein
MQTPTAEITEVKATETRRSTINVHGEISHRLLIIIQIPEDGHPGAEALKIITAIIPTAVLRAAHGITIQDPGATAVDLTQVVPTATHPMEAAQVHTAAAPEAAAVQEAVVAALLAEVREGAVAQHTGQGVTNA